MNAIIFVLILTFVKSYMKRVVIIIEILYIILIYYNYSFSKA